MYERQRETGNLLRLGIGWKLAKNRPFTDDVHPNVAGTLRLLWVKGQSLCLDKAFL